MGRKMQKLAKYVIFRTKWGYFGLAGTESALCRSYLPGPNLESVKFCLLASLPSARLDKNFFGTLQERITAYFDGCPVEFGKEIPVALDGFTTFGASVLTACRNIRLGQTTTYSGLAKKTGRPAASRAVGSALARNPLPLIIPCHRVVRTDGKLGGFSAPGGENLKKRLLLHEKRSTR
ncbi:MAG: methylated-DNA--[protein]-cysteine S-methyltransferase [Planctomycetota bacterium]